MKILIVDDDPVSRRVLKEIIAQDPAGHQITEASGGAEAWSLLDNPARYFDIAVLDVSMPDTDGVALLSRIRESPILRSLRVVMCTAAADRPTVAKIIGLGARHYIVKPPTAAVVRAKLTQIADELSGEPAPRPRLAGHSFA